ncbi:FlaA1/EpsC-like NDP-sugar epimerase [Jezberella montanilacus]|uniref:FlaA1/EpsC-like NDP-sugar epimerase n=1 Tax=Jezberella montanilacus TaxID=323426 RepID=A0A2T0XI69_9BURK|nr:nucleoside-diphosphate sugar epimerase/dehydratase [Jezberella montanilacus]PRY98636.1 FlaA1/EpsC-like NDP-sugar epimerase [Jezberella montanilacus]
MTNPSTTATILNLPRVTKRLVVLVVDASICVFTVWFAFYLRLGEFVSLSGPAAKAALVSMGLAIPIFMIGGLYRAIFRYSGWPAFMAITKATAIYGLVYAALFTAFSFEGIPRTVGLIQPILLLLAIGGSRALAGYWLGGAYKNLLTRSTLPKVLVYGAGSSGQQLAAAMAHSHEMKVVGFLDDDIKLQGHVINGLPVHSPVDLSNLIDSLQVTDVLLALPSISRKRRNEIINAMLDAKVSVRTLPSVTELAQGKISTSDLRELDIDDLLGREMVHSDDSLLAQHTEGKVILVTGAGGSIGGELCRQLLRLSPASLLLIEQSEFALYEIHQDLLPLAEKSGTSLIPLLCSVQDFARMRDIILMWRPYSVYHAAAYKHVPLVEHNPVEGIKNNVFGTLQVARAALGHVSKFVLISTDKAVRPTNIMGASKRLAEMVLQGLAEHSTTGLGSASTAARTVYSMVRFGNVLGSSGSVVPKFREQIKNGGPITLTHPDITRYFMTIQEAAQLVLQAGAMSQGGDLFVLDMGQPVKIIDLAKRMIDLSGLTLKDQADEDGDIEIEITGLRPGEKLYEELLIGDNPQATVHPRIMTANESCLPWSEFEIKLNALQIALDQNNVSEIRSLLLELVSGYQPEGAIVDWLTLAQEQKAN